jgi:tRNA(fMet)-specific endonuclease VapC
MGLVIDTNIFIDAENGRFELANLSKFSHHGEAYIAAVTVSELLVGVHMAKNYDLRIRRSAFVEGILANIPVLDFNEEVARVYSEIYSHFLKPRSKKEGNVHDLQIAATAIAYGYPVLTSNTADFNKIPGLDWESPC